MGRKIASLQRRLQILEARPTSLDNEKEIGEVQKGFNIWLEAENTMWQ